MKWDEKYRPIGNNIGGGQGICFAAERLSDRKRCFIKILKENFTERRQRFFRETTLFRSLDIDGIPKIIDTNVEDFNGNEELYYCSEYIEGMQLDQMVAQTECSEETIVNLFEQLLIILDKIHKLEIVHRDIKPENIIVSNGKVYLVDFGISVNIQEEQRLTKGGHEIGNRFLRLPEFAAGSTSKRDSRSDLTLASGIAVYLLTKEYPRTLVNENGKFPHQTEVAVSNIRKTKKPYLWNTIFDKAFQQDLSKRWTCANDIFELLYEIMEEDYSETEKIEKQLALHAQQIMGKNFTDLKKNLTELNKYILENVLKILRDKAKGFRIEQMGWVYNLGDIVNKNQIRAYPFGKREHVVINIITELLGEQIVGYLEIQGTNQELCRIANNTMLADNETVLLNEKISERLLPELAKMIC